MAGPVQSPGAGGMEYGGDVDGIAGWAWMLGYGKKVLKTWSAGMVRWSWGGCYSELRKVRIAGLERMERTHGG